MAPRTRRRATRQADVDYDRTADTPAQDTELPGGHAGADAHREVSLDDGVAAENAEEPRGEEFYREQMPPHHGA